MRCIPVVPGGRVRIVGGSLFGGCGMLSLDRGAGGLMLTPCANDGDTAPAATSNARAVSGIKHLFNMIRIPLTCAGGVLPRNGTCAIHGWLACDGAIRFANPQHLVSGDPSVSCSFMRPMKTQSSPQRLTSIETK